MPRTIGATRVATLLGEFDRTPAYQGLAEGLRVLLADGRIPVGTRLPSERDLTAALAVSRTTVARAYAELREHGYLTSRQGAGSVATLPEDRGRRRDHLLAPGDPDGRSTDLTVAAPTPGPGVLAAYQRALAELPPYLAGTGYHPAGLPVLREAVAEAYAARGLPTSPDQVMVTPGALAGVAIAARTLLATGDRAVLESPTYPNAIAALAQCGARTVGVDVPPDAATEGPDVEGLVTTLRQVVPRAAYLVPDFHNPTGALLDDAGREQVAGALGRTRTTAVVDESMVLLGLDGRPMPRPLAAYAPDAISVGSLSKVFWGGLRIGWLRVPPGRLEQCLRSRLSLDLGAPVLEQLVAADLLRTGASLVEHRRDALRTSRDAALEAVAEHLPDWRRRPAGGLNLWCELPAALSSALVARAEQHGVILAAGPAFAPEGGLDRFVRLPYTQPPHVLRDAAARLAAAWRQTLADPGGLGGRSRTLVA